MSTIDSLFRSLWLGTASHLWQSSLVLALIFLLARAMRSAPAGLLQLLWWSALLKLILPLSLLGGAAGRVGATLFATRGAENSLAPSAITTALRAILDPLYSVTVVTATSSAAAAARPSRSLWVLTAIWAAGAAWVLLQGAGRRVTWARAAEAPSSDPGMARSRLDAALAGTLIPAERVVRVKDDLMPAVTGLFEPRILVPERAVLELGTDELRAVLLHEEGHRRRRDPLLAALQRICLAVFFYYPPIWIVLRRLRAAAEISCDEHALRAGVAPDCYARALGRTMSLGLAPALTHGAAGADPSSLVRDRFQRVRESWKYTAMPKHKLAAAAAVAVVIAGSFYPITPVVGFDTRPRTGQNGAGSDENPKTASEAARPAPAGEEAGGKPRTAISDAPKLVGGDVAPPVLIDKVDPKYPADARSARVEGRVILEAIIDDTGFVSDVRVLGGVEGFPTMAEEAARAVRKWRYEPATQNGMPVRVSFTVIIQFSLENGSAPNLPVLERLEERNEMIDLVLTDASIDQVLRLIQKLADVSARTRGATSLEVVARGNFPSDLRVSIAWRRGTLKWALERLADQYGLTYEVPDSKTLIVTHVSESDAKP